MGCLKKLGIILSFSIIIIFIINYKSKYNLNDEYIEGIIDKYKFDGDKLSLEVIGRERIICTYYFSTIEEKEYYLNNIKYGQKVYLNGKIKEPNENTNFKSFNYKKYLLSKKIHYIFQIKEINIKNEINILYKIKNYLVKKINKLSSPYLYAFVLGDTSHIEENAKESFQTNGISHLLAISGMHITFLFNALYNILNKIKKTKFNIIIISILLFIYLFLVSFSPSSIRAGIMFLVSKIKKVKSYYILLILFIIFLLYNPYYIYSIGFLLSFIVTFYILIFKDLITGNYLKKTILTSLISFIASAPIIIYNYNSINLLSIFLNLLFVPLVSYIIFPISFISLLLNQSKIYILLTTIMEKCSLFLTEISINIILKDIGLFIIIYVIIGIFILTKLKIKKYKYLILYLIVILIHSNLFNIYPTITFIDVGQGDSILIELPFNKGNILIDTGGQTYFETWRIKSYSISKNTIIPYLKKRGIKKLDYVVATHGDTDHMGESINLVQNFNVKKIIMNNNDYNNLELNLIKNLKKLNIPYYKGIKEINISDYKLKFLNKENYDDENDSSNVIYTEINGYKLLFMGDAGIKVEENIIKQYNLENIDILKVGHHGSKTSSSKKFIDYIKPKYSVISVGKNNMYGHPNTSVLNNLEHSKIYRTDEDGSIMFKIKNNNLMIKTCIP